MGGQLYAIEETFTFMTDGTFTATLSRDDGLNRSIGAGELDGNIFTTTYSQDPGSESGTGPIRLQLTASLPSTSSAKKGSKLQGC